jgi:hypothetical protein
VTAKPAEGPRGRALFGPSYYFFFLSRGGFTFGFG